MFKLLTNRWIQTFILLGMLGLAVFCSFSDARWRQQIRNATFDYYNIQRPREAGDNIVIVDIDEASLAHKDLGQWPWSRNKLALLINQLKSFRASVIVFDMVFAESDRTSPSRVLALLGKGSDDLQNIKNMLVNFPDNDQIFADAIRKAGNVVTGISFSNDDMTLKSPHKTINIIGNDVAAHITNRVGATANLKKISKHAAGNGGFSVSPDVDGIIRRVPMLIAHTKHGDSIIRIYPSLSLEAIRVQHHLPAEIHVQMLEVNSEIFGVEGVQFRKGSKLIPTNDKGEFLIHFAAHKKEWYISALKVFDGSVDPNKIKGKIVLIGTSAVGLRDIRSTPLAPFRPGVEVHLNIIDQILQGRFLYRSRGAKVGEAVVIIGVGLMIILLSPFVGSIVQLFVVVSIITSGLFAGLYAYTEYGLLIDVLYPSIALTLIFIVSTLLTYIRTETERKQVRQAFGLYISPDFMEELTSNPDKLVLGGEVRELSVMFTDIRSFTTISEHLSPEALIQLMNDFLTPMSDLVMSHRGTIDKYMGDAMMAFWNAPLDDDEHARHACQAALKMNEALTPINEQLKIQAEAEQRKPLLLQAGIGINTGPTSVGNMGSKQRFAYSALGDTVNLASRLEGQTKSYGINILIGEKTHKQVSDFATLELDLLQVKGRTAPERVFTLLGDEVFAAEESFKSWQKAHNAMIASYRAKDFAGAANHITECKKLSGEQITAFYELYENRIIAFRTTPPPEDWGGVFVATSK